MGYKIDNVDTPVLDAWMDARDVIVLLDEIEHTPEGCFLLEIEEEARDALASAKQCAACDTAAPFESLHCAKCGAKLPAVESVRITLPHLWWYGEGSGSSFEDLRDVVAPKIRGRVDAIFTWEGGDSVSGLRIDDGKVTECAVVMTLVPKGAK